MAVTITSLGTDSGSSGTLQFTYAEGFVASAGDWIVTCVAADGECVTVTLYDSSTSRSDTCLCVVSLINTGNVANSICIGHLAFDTASGDYLQTFELTSGQIHATIYKIVGIDYAISLSSQTENDASTSNLDASYKRRGLLFQGGVGTLTSIDLRLYKYGSPTGTAYLRLRSVVGDSIIGTLGTLDVSTLTTSGAWKTFNATPVALTDTMPFRLLLEYADGTATDYVRWSVATAAGIAQNTYYTTSYYTSALVTVGNAVQNVTGITVLYPFDKSGTGTGNGTAMEATTSGNPTAAGDLAVGNVGIEYDTGDGAGTWESDSNNDVHENTQRVGSGSGGAKGITLESAASLVDVNSTTAHAHLTYPAKRDWAAIVATFIAYTAPPSYIPRHGVILHNDPGVV